MAKIEIPFNSWSRDKIQKGIKTTTCRTGRLGKRGDFFSVDMTRYVLIGVLSYKLEIVAKQFYKEEGCKSPEEFKEVWKSLHPYAGYQSSQNVFLHFFRKP